MAWIQDFKMRKAEFQLSRCYWEFMLESVHAWIRHANHNFCDMLALNKYLLNWWAFSDSSPTVKHQAPGTLFVFLIRLFHFIIIQVFTEVALLVGWCVPWACEISVPQPRWNPATWWKHQILTTRWQGISPWWTLILLHNISCICSPIFLLVTTFLCYFSALPLKETLHRSPPPGSPSSTLQATSRFSE